jgi:hypothetical protein
VGCVARARASNREGVWALLDGSVNDPPVSTIRRWWEKIATCRSSTPFRGPLVLTERSGCPPHGSTPVSFVGRSPALDVVPSLLFSRRSFSHPLLALLLLPSIFDSEEFHKGKTSVPETRGVAEGSTKRNIQRKHSHDPKAHAKKQGGGAGGKGKWDPTNDGSMD